MTKSYREELEQCLREGYQAAEINGAKLPLATLVAHLAEGVAVRPVYGSYGGNGLRLYAEDKPAWSDLLATVTWEPETNYDQDDENIHSWQSEAWDDYVGSQTPAEFYGLSMADIRAGVTLYQVCQNYVNQLPAETVAAAPTGLADRLAEYIRKSLRLGH